MLQISSTVDGCDLELLLFEPPVAPPGERWNPPPKLLDINQISFKTTFRRQ